MAITHFELQTINYQIVFHLFYFNYLFSAIMLALFDDWHKLRGLNMKPNSRDDLQEALQTSSTSSLFLSMFEL